jgi:adenine/guanine phosphoribosyltransferase-like PRPP-binding protein
VHTEILTTLKGLGVEFKIEGEHPVLRSLSLSKLLHDIPFMRALGTTFASFFHDDDIDIVVGIGNDAACGAVISQWTTAALVEWNAKSPKTRYVSSVYSSPKDVGLGLSINGFGGVFAKKNTAIVTDVLHTGDTVKRLGDMLHTKHEANIVGIATLGKRIDVKASVLPWGLRIHKIVDVAGPEPHTKQH